MYFCAIPTVFVTTQLKVESKSSSVTFFKSKLFTRIDPSIKDDLKQERISKCRCRTKNGESICLYAVFSSFLWLQKYLLVRFYYSVTAERVFGERAVDEPIDEGFIVVTVWKSAAVKQQLLTCRDEHIQITTRARAL